MIQRGKISLIRVQCSFLTRIRIYISSWLRSWSTKLKYWPTGVGRNKKGKLSIGKSLNFIKFEAKRRSEKMLKSWFYIVQNRWRVPTAQIFLSLKGFLYKYCYNWQIFVTKKPDNCVNVCCYHLIRCLGDRQENDWLRKYDKHMDAVFPVSAPGPTIS